MTDIIKKWCDENNIVITEEQLSKLDLYASLLKEWNEKMNLTAITDDEGIAVRHFIDSMTLLQGEGIKDGSRIIDIGTGAGFPGIPLLIMCPDIKLTLLDSLNKRIIFLDEVCRRLGLSSELVHGRAEEFSLKPEYREKYDYAVSRAVANLPALCEYCIPYVKVGGMFIAMKGPEGTNELFDAENAISLLGGAVHSTDAVSLPDGSSRVLIRIKKQKPTPQKYPRRGQKINKNPL